MAVAGQLLRIQSEFILSVRVRNDEVEAELARLQQDLEALMEAAKERLGDGVFVSYYVRNEELT